MQQHRENSGKQVSGQQEIGASATYAGPLEQDGELSIWHKVHDHIHVCGVLEKAPKVDNEGMLNGHERALLVLGARDLFRADDILLAKDLYCVEPEASHCIDRVKTRRDQ